MIQVQLAFFVCALAPGPPPSSPVISLRDALRRLARDHDIEFVYADDLVDPILLSLPDGLTLAPEGLSKLLAGTCIEARWISRNRVVLLPAADSAKWSCAGSVFDASSGDPITDALVWVVGTWRVARSDELGGFTISQLPAQRAVELRVRAPGYAVGQVAAAPGERFRIALRQPARLLERMDVVQSSNDPAHRRQPNSYVIRPNRMAVASGGDDLFDLLRTLPGVSPNRLGESGVSFRGSEPAENLVLLDGMTLYQMDHALGYYSAINADIIDQALIFKGAYPARYGERTAGVLDLETNRGRPHGIEGMVGVDRDMAKAILAVPFGDHVDLWVSHRQTINSQTSELVYGRVFERTFNEAPSTFEDVDEVSANQSYDFDDTVAKLSWRGGQSARLTLTAFDGRDRSSETIDFLIQPQPLTVYDRAGAWGNRGASLRLGLVPGDGFAVDVTAAWSEYTSGFEYEEARFDEDTVSIDDIRFRRGNIDNLMDDRVLAANLTYDRGETWSVQTGFESRNIKTTYVEETVDGAGSRPSQTSLTSFFAQLDWHPVQRFVLSLGARDVHNRLSQSARLEPRTTITTNLAPELTLRLGYGEFSQHVLRTPDTINYFSGIKTWFLAEAGIQPATSDQSFLGIRWDRPHMLIDLECYARRFSGNITKLFDPSLPDRQPFQTAGRADGFDLHLERTIGSHRLQLAYSHQRSRVTDNISRQIPLDYPTDSDRPHTLKLLTEWHLGTWLAVASWSYASGLPYGEPDVLTLRGDNGQRRFELSEPLEPNGLRLDDNHQLDVSLRYRFAWDLVQGEVGVAVSNIYDHQNTVYRYYVLDGPEAVPVDVRGLGATPQLHLRMHF